MKMSDLISRRDVIEKLRKHRMLFCKNRVEYSALSKAEKARVDEIDNCIAELVNIPSAEPETITIEEVSNQLGCATIQSALYWFEFLKTLDLLGFAIVRKKTR